MRKFVTNEFMEEKYREFRSWFFSKFSQSETHKFRRIYYEEFEKTQLFMPFVNWFIGHFILKSQDELLVLQRSWMTMEGKKITSPYPPEEALRMNQIQTKAYHDLHKLEENQATIREINSMVRAQNFTKYSSINPYLAK